MRSKATLLSKRCGGHHRWRLSATGKRESVVDDPSIDREWEGVYDYDRIIALLMEAMQRDHSDSWQNSCDNMEPARKTSRYAGSFEGSKGWHPPSHVGTARLRSDVVVAAVCYSRPRFLSTRAHGKCWTAILCGYEFLGAGALLWSHHLNGTRLLGYDSPWESRRCRLSKPAKRLSGIMPVKINSQRVSLLP